MVQTVKFIEAGYCKQHERLVNPVAGSWKEIRFSSSVAVIEHAKEGIVLLDTGYSPRFAEATRHFPEKLYSLATKIEIEPEGTAVEKLKKMGISVKDVRHVVLSHFHGDHIAGASDFTHAKYIFSNEELRFFKGRNRFNQVRQAFLAALVPTDLELRQRKLTSPFISIPELGPGWMGQDLFGDESILVVPLPGHTLGQIGLLVRPSSGAAYFLVADAAWLKDSVEKNIPPGLLPRIVFYNNKEYDQTLDRLHEVYKADPLRNRVRIIPCHCHETLTREGMQ